MSSQPAALFGQTSAMGEARRSGKMEWAAERRWLDRTGSYYRAGREQRRDP